MKTISHITKKEITHGAVVYGRDIREGIFELIHRDHPSFTAESTISIDELNHYRRQYLAELVEQKHGNLQEDFLKALRENEAYSRNTGNEPADKLTAGQRVADKIAEFGGSWTFILLFFAFLLAWMAVNVWLLINKPFDPYPFILLNLILSCLAAIQAPIIMMSQNRQEEKDRQRAEHDYHVNLKAELEIRLLHEKIDHLLTEQNRRLMEIQAVQVDYLEDLMQNREKSKSKKT